jgi:hypothetical protein
MTYSFKNKKGKIIIVEMKISEYDVYVAAHPELERYLDTPPAVTYEGKTYGSAQQRVKGGFREVLQKIGEQNPYTALGDEHRKNKTIKEIKTREVVRAYAKKKAKALQQRTYR